MANGNELSDIWFYDELNRIWARDKDILNLRRWCGRERGVRWRSLPESFWLHTQKDSEWETLLSKVPQKFRDELEFAYAFIFEALRHIAPNFDTIWANHGYMEWLLYHNLDHERYREHIVHPVKVAVLAQWLLRESGRIEQVASNLGNDEHVQRCLSQLSLSQSFFLSHGDAHKVIKSALWLAGLCHDFGYGHNFACQVERRLRDSYGFYAGDVVGGSVSGVNRHSIERSLLLRYLLDESSVQHILLHKRLPDVTGISPQEDWRVSLYRNLYSNHSVAGGLNLLCLLEEIIEYWTDVDPRLVLVFELAAEAVFLHDLTKEDKYVCPGNPHRTTTPVGACQNTRPLINFRDTPLAVILISADELQDWGRPRLEYKQSTASDEMRVKFREPCHPMKVAWDPVPEDDRPRTLRLVLNKQMPDDREIISCPVQSNDRLTYEDFIILVPS